MANRWHKVMVNGIARYRASASKSYVSYNVAKDSWSSKMLPGNLPVEQLAKAPKSIKVKGSAWGVEVARSYMEGQEPVTHMLAYRGRSALTSWIGGKNVETTPADPTYVSFASNTAIESQRSNSVEQVARLKARIAEKAAGTAGEFGWGTSYNDVVIVELS